MRLFSSPLEQFFFGRCMWKENRIYPSREDTSVKCQMRASFYSTQSYFLNLNKSLRIMVEQLNFSQKRKQGLEMEITACSHPIRILPENLQKSKNIIINDYKHLHLQTSKWTEVHDSAVREGVGCWVHPIPSSWFRIQPRPTKSFIHPVI